MFAPSRRTRIHTLQVVDTIIDLDRPLFKHHTYVNFE
jgi:hypothetical protein